MMRDVAPRAARRGCGGTAPCSALLLPLLDRLARACRRPPSGLAPTTSSQQVEDRPVLDHQPPVHIGLAEAEPRIADDVEQRRGGRRARTVSCLAAARARSVRGLPSGMTMVSAAACEQVREQPCRSAPCSNSSGSKRIAASKRRSASQRSSRRPLRGRARRGSSSRAAVFSWPQAASMSRPRGVRTGAEMPASNTMLRKAADPLGRRAFVGRAGPRVERDQIDLGRQLVVRGSAGPARARRRRCRSCP